MKSDCPCAILIISCDKYSDLWKPFFKLFFKNWPDCPYPVFLGSNTKVFKSNKRVKTILSGADIDWSSSYIKILKQIKVDHLFVLHDDFFIISKIDDDLIKMCFDFLKKNKARHIHPFPIPVADDLQSNKYFGKYDKKAPYRVTVKGFWDKKYLESLLIKGENPWDFEIMGSYRSSYDEGFYCCKSSLFKYLHIVEKGKYFYSSVKYCQKYNIALNLKKRKTLNLIRNIASLILLAYAHLFYKTNWRWRLKTMNLLRKFLVSY